MALHRAITEKGVIEGIPGGNPTITVFKGIPYAAPPIGKNRWREPQPVERWQGIYRANAFKGICPQKKRKMSRFSKRTIQFHFKRWARIAYT